MHKTRGENCVLFGELSVDLSWKTAVQRALGDCSEEVREEQDIQEFLQ